MGKLAHADDSKMIEAAIINAVLVSLCWMPVLIVTAFAALRYRQDYLMLRAKLIQAADDFESKEIESRKLVAVSQKRGETGLMLVEEARAGSFRYATENIRVLLKYL